MCGGHFICGFVSDAVTDKLLISVDLNADGVAAVAVSAVLEETGGQSPYLSDALVATLSHASVTSHSPSLFRFLFISAIKCCLSSSLIDSVTPSFPVAAVFLSPSAAFPNFNSPLLPLVTSRIPSFPLLLLLPSQCLVTVSIRVC